MEEIRWRKLKISAINYSRLFALDFWGSDDQLLPRISKI